MAALAYHEFTDFPLVMNFLLLLSGSDSHTLKIKLAIDLQVIEVFTVIFVKQFPNTNMSITKNRTNSSIDSHLQKKCSMWSSLISENCHWEVVRAYINNPTSALHVNLMNFHWDYFLKRIALDWIYLFLWLGIYAKQFLIPFGALVTYGASNPTKERLGIFWRSSLNTFWCSGMNHSSPGFNTRGRKPIYYPTRACKCLTECWPGQGPDDAHELNI